MNRLSHVEYHALLHKVCQAHATRVWITGDIGDPSNNWKFLNELLEAVNRSVYFLLGNHDFYQGTISQARQKAAKICQQHSNAFYLHECEGFMMDGHLVLGVDGWANTDKTSLHGTTWDSEQIFDLQNLSIEQLQQVMNQFAEEDTALLLKKCRQSLSSSIHSVCIFTHIPPVDARLGSGKTRAMQEMRTVFYSEALSKGLHELTKYYPKVNFQVFSGHLHRKISYGISNNLQGYVANAYHPEQPLRWITW